MIFPDGTKKGTRIFTATAVQARSMFAFFHVSYEETSFICFFLNVLSCDACRLSVEHLVEVKLRTQCSRFSPEFSHIVILYVNALNRSEQC